MIVEPEVAHDWTAVAEMSTSKSIPVSVANKAHLFYEAARFVYVRMFLVADGLEGTRARLKH